MIYIDPPYNTGSDGFVYPDKFEYSDQALKDMFGMSDKELGRLKDIQGKATHSAWLTFMYPRLWLAKRLLSDEGRIFISIDDNEHSNLKLICDEIFGEISYVGSIAWESKTKSQNTKTSFDKLQPKIETILVYSKTVINHFNLIVTGEKEYPNEDNLGFYREYILETMSAEGIRGRETMIFEVEGISPPKGMQWKLGKEKIEYYKNNNSLNVKDGKIIIKIRPHEEENTKTDPFWGFFPKSIGTAETAKKELNKIMDAKELFDTVKPSALIKRLIYHSTNENSIILDFFAGSSTTADAVMQLNAEAEIEAYNSRKFIMVQLPEKTYSINNDGEKEANKGSKEAFDAGYMSIDEISRKRIKNASKIVQEKEGLSIPENFDGGFKHYYVVAPEQPTLDDIESFDMESGLFKDNSGQLVNLLESGFDDMIQPFSSEGLKVSGNATGVDTIVTTWLVQDGYKMDVETENIDLDGYEAIYVDNSRLYLIHEKWNATQTKALLNLIGTNQLKVQTIVIYGYSFNLESIRELEIGLKQLDSKVNLIKRY